MELLQWVMPWMMELPQWTLAWVVALFLVGLVFLFSGGHMLVDGSSKLARTLGINSMIIGLTVVALGTSMPEFLVSLVAALRGNTDVALGNIIGSNVSNIGLILGLSALARPIAVQLHLLRIEVPLMIAISIYFWVICATGLELSRLDGLSLALGFIGYLVVVIAGARKGSRVHDEKFAPLRARKWPIARDVIFILLGILGLSYGATWVVNSAVEISHRVGVSELVLGLTVVALGTSLPELATSVVAAIKKEGDISLGNIIGSNIFNMMAVAGPSALVHPLPVSEELRRNQLPVMVALTVILLPLLRTGRKISRLEGAFLLVSYCIIVVWWTL
ncbi:MAG: calcium/sodium antiporter [bacterium]